MHGLQVALGVLIAQKMRGDNFENYKNFFKSIGLPTKPEDIDLTTDELVKAIDYAPQTRPDRITILEKQKLNKKQLEQSRLKAVERKAVNKEVRGMIDKLKKLGSKLKYMRPEYRNKIRDLLYTIDYKVKYRTETKLEQLTKLKQYIEDNPDSDCRND